MLTHHEKLIGSADTELELNIEATCHKTGWTDMNDWCVEAYRHIQVFIQFSTINETHTWTKLSFKSSLWNFPCCVSVPFLSVFWLITVSWSYMLSSDKKHILFTCNELCYINKIATVVCSTQVALKVWDYRCLLSFFVSFFFFRRTDHTLCAVSVMKDNGWLMRAEHPHICCVLKGGVLRDTQPFGEVLGCGKLQLGHDWETPQCLNCSFPQHYIIACPFFSSHIKQSWTEPVYGTGSRRAFGCPETWSPDLHVFCTCELTLNEMIEV